MHPFQFLILTEARNRLRRQSRRLRNPRYALALVAGLAYFWFAFGGSDAFSGSRRQDTALPELIRTLGPLLLAVYVAGAWLFGKAEALAFRPAEVHLLFPAPLTRRDLLRYRLLHAQLPLFFTCTFITLASAGAALPWWLRFPSIWLLFATLHLHQLAAALVHAAAVQQGLVGWRRNWLPILLFSAAAVVLLVTLSGAYGGARAAPSFTAGLTVIQHALNQGLAAIVLTPFRWAMAPVLGTVAEWPSTAAIAAGLLLLHYVWVLRSDAAFEESAAALGERRAKAALALRTGGGWRSYARALSPENGKRRAAPPPPFALRPQGAPEVALVWKNLTFARRNFSGTTLIVAVATAIALIGMFQAGGATRSEALEHVGSMTLVLGAFAVLVGPLWARNDLRMDLLRIDVLRALPLEPGRLVAAEITASAVTASIMSLALLAAGTGLLLLSGELPLSPGYFLLAAIGTALVVPALATLGVTVQCALALLFPAWIHLGKERPGGVEAMGQSLITLAASTLLLALLLLPPLAIGALAALLFAMQWGLLAPALGGLIAIAACYVQVWFAARALGRLFARTDAADIGLTT